MFRGIRNSLYWRILLGFIFFLAVTLGLQAALFIWVGGETEGGMPERMGRDFAELVASEFESALARDPQLDLRAYAQRRISELHRPAAIIFADGTSIAQAGLDVPPGLRIPPFRRRGRGGEFGGPGGFGGGPGIGPGERMPPEGPGMRGGFGGPIPDRNGGVPRMFGPTRRGPVMAPIVRNEQIVAVVWVPPLTGWRRFAESVGTPVALGGLLLLIGVTAVAALVIFRPAQARLHALEDAAR